MTDAMRPREYSHRIPGGPAIRIVSDFDGRWRLCVGKDEFGDYASPEDVLADLVAGHSFGSFVPPAPGAAFSVPDDLSAWERRW